MAALSATLVLYCTRAEPQTNPASRLAAIDALVHDGTYAIDHSVFRDTIDKVAANGHFYSTKPPLLSTVGAGVYWLVYHLTGRSFRDASQGAAIYLVTTALMLPCHLLLLWLFFLLLERWQIAAAPRLLGFAALSFGYLGLGYATTLNNHVPAATLALACFYHATMARQTGEPRRYVWAGVFGALAPAVDLGAVFVVMPIAVALVVHDWRRFARWFVPAAVPPLALHWVLTYLVAGTVLPIYLHKELYQYAGSYWTAPVGLDALREPKSVYLFHLLLGHHGVFAMTPLLAVGLWQALASVWRRQARVVETSVVLSGFVMLVVFYTATTSNYGGFCVGFRWLMMVMPLLLLLAVDWLNQHATRWGYGLFGLLLIVGACHAVNTLYNPWHHSWWHRALWPHSVR